VQYRDDVDKLSAYTIDRNIRKSWDNEYPSAGDDAGGSPTKETGRAFQ